MHKAEQRRWWRTEWLTRVQELSDINTQKATWLNPRPRTWNPHYSFVEYATCYIEYADWTGRVAVGLISAEEAAVVADLDNMVRGYTPPRGDDFDHAAILADPKWGEIVEAAQRVRACLRPMIADPDELAALEVPSQHAVEAAVRAIGDAN